MLDFLVRERNQASYDLAAAPKYAADRHAIDVIDRAVRAIERLDAIEADPARLAAAIAALPP